MIDRKDLCFYKQIQAFCLMTSCFGCISWVFLKGVLNSIFFGLDPLKGIKRLFGGIIVEVVKPNDLFL